MATEVQTQLLDVVGLLQAAPIEQNVEAPTFESSPSSEALLGGPAQLSKRTMTSFAKSYVAAGVQKFNVEPDDSLRNQYFEAIQYASQLPKEKRLETFNSFHQKCASYLINVFYRIPLTEFKKAVEYAAIQVNESLLKYALSVALIHREDAVGHNLQLPSHLNTDPGMYFDMSKVTNDIKDPKVTDRPTQTGKIEPVYVNINANFTATNQDPEHKVAYFREDIGLNLHHRHWHEVYPFMAEEDIVKKDRRGELFYYMHQQIVARYNFERLCNGLPRASPYSDFREPIEEAYFPKLDSLAKTSQFCSRPANAVLKDLHRDDFYTTLSTLERWRDRIFDAIDRGCVYTRNKNTNEVVMENIEESDGIDKLGNTIEAVEKLSWNYRYYGDLHNKGHLFFSYVHDPDNRFRENGSVMSHAETALRDPIFYRWHVFIDDIFQHYKRTLPSYTVEQRQFKGININSVKILPQEPKPPQTDENQDEHSYHVSNVLKTFWEKDAVDITQGILNLDPKEKIFAVFTHLQHKNFEYEIQVENNLSENVTGTVRIFMAPYQDESGIQMSFNGQRRMFIEMDKFTAQLDAGTTTTIKRKSTESSVTIPFKKSFMTMDDVKEFVEDPTLNKQLNDAKNGYCGCGWPHHLLVGKGTTGEGYRCDLFVMITNYDDDKVEESPLIQKCCDKSSLSYCGVRNKKYPDRKPMGFPFDRDIANKDATIYDFITEKQEAYDKKHPSERNTYRNGPARLSNMMVVPLLVRHEGGFPKCGQSLKDAGFTEETCRKLVKTTV